VDNYGQSELAEKLQKYEVKTPVTNHAFTPPMEFNLMFGTSIGPGGNVPG